jgi:hypothetical protein
MTTIGKSRPTAVMGSQDFPVPPMLFCGNALHCSRHRPTGIGCSHRRWRLRQGRRDPAQLLAVSLLMISLCYGPLFLGMKFVASGTAAVLEMSLMPLALLAFGITMGEERWSSVFAGAWRAITSSRDHGDSSSATFFGLLAVAWAAISSAWGSGIGLSSLGRCWLLFGFASGFAFFGGKAVVAVPDGIRPIVAIMNGWLRLRALAGGDCFHRPAGGDRGCVLFQHCRAISSTEKSS